MVAYSTKEKMQDALERELYLQRTGYTAAIEVYPGGQQDSLDYGPVLVEIVVLDSDGKTIAYRVSTDSHDDNWEIGEIEDAVKAAIAYREQVEDM